MLKLKAGDYVSFSNDVNNNPKFHSWLTGRVIFSNQDWTPGTPPPLGSYVTTRVTQDAILPNSLLTDIPYYGYEDQVLSLAIQNNKLIEISSEPEGNLPNWDQTLNQNGHFQAIGLNVFDLLNIIKEKPMITLLGYFSTAAAATAAALANQLVKPEDTTQILDNLLALIEEGGETRWAYSINGAFQAFTAMNASNLIGLSSEVVNIITSTDIDAARLKRADGTPLTYEQIFSAVQAAIENAQVAPQTYKPYHLKADLSLVMTSQAAWEAWLSNNNFPNEPILAIHDGPIFTWAGLVDPNITLNFDPAIDTAYRTSAGDIIEIGEEGEVDRAKIINPDPHSYITALQWDIDADGTIEIGEGGTNYQFRYTGTTNQPNGWAWEEIHQLDSALLQTLGDFHANGGANAYALKSEIHTFLILRTDYNPKIGSTDSLHPSFGISLEPSYPNMSCWQALSGDMTGMFAKWLNPSNGGPGSGQNWKLLGIAH